ncbi:MAG: flagellar hook-length control protein FliK [Betaproteobacteria bacterium]|nr:flagellar hook-length control protein FliK [Betaproteobacteria bacterium]
MLTGPEAIGIAGGKPLPIYLEGRAIPVQEAVGRELGLKFNEVVRGVVEARGETLLLKLQGREVELPAQLRFRPGEVLWLRYTEMGRGMVLVPTAGQAAAGVAGGGAGAAGHAAAAMAAPAPIAGGWSLGVASLFLRPADLSGLLTLLTGSGLFAGLAQRVQGQGASPGPLGQWFASRLSMARLSPESVRQAMRASGLFTESMLAHGSGPAVGDLKLALRQALAEIDLDTLEQGLKEKLESSLHELESSQADAMVAATQRDLALSFVIPFKDADPVLVSFFRPPRSEQEPNPPSVINIYTRSESLGEVWLKTVVFSGDVLELTMWAAHDEVAQRARRAISELDEEMASAGLVLRSMTVLAGRRPPDSPPAELKPGAVLDLKA